jgi:hypothetical protein
MTTTIQHQLSSTNQHYIPTWEINYLLVGTFNPSGGEHVNYYYGRKTNMTWKLFSTIFGEEINPNNSNFIKLLKKHKIGCVDLITSVTCDESFRPYIIGKSYKDSKIINKKVEREYNTAIINQLSKTNPNLKIFSTWGKGPNLKEWRLEVEKIKINSSLLSPSKAARVPKGVNKFEYVLSDWKEKFNK